jgi:4-hydroxy-tetrahydrodipicolinate synthase
LKQRATRVSGPCAAVLTPVDDRLEPDLARLTGHVRWLLEHGCDGINLLGTTGEAVSFSVEQRRRVMDAIADNGLPLDRIMVGTGATALADAVNLTRYADERGYAGALVIPPFYYKEVRDDAVLAFYEELIERVDRPSLRLYLYHFPALSGVGFTVDIIERLRGLYPSTIVGLKDSSGVPGFAAQIASAFPGFDVFPSSEAVLSTALSNGFAGCISATLNVSAPIAQSVWRASDGTSAADAQRGLADIRTALTSVPLVPALHYVVARLRRDESWLRSVPPIAQLSQEQRVALYRRLDELPVFAQVAAVWDQANTRGKGA